ncbi:hypothetical protein [Maribellus mangrovi]|uniref:hypothetical protein n=1 Tax=Maribellus mangrovi TaxID=3133146 RepID=UPI0030EEFA9B
MRRKQTKNFIQLFVLAVIISFTVVSCSKTEDLGEYTLMEGTKDALPYTEDLLLTFSDSLGNQTEFVYEADQDGYGMGYQEGVSGTGNEYSAKIEKYGCYIGEVDDALNVEFRVGVGVNVDYETNLEIIDMLSATISYYNDGNYDEDYIQVVVNPRDASSEYISTFQEPMAELTLLGKTFQNVYESKRSKLYFTSDTGIVGFRDLDNKLWVLEKTETK